MSDPEVLRSIVTTEIGNGTGRGNGNYGGSIGGESIMSITAIIRRTGTS